MREIKFRGITTDGEWLYGVPVKSWWYGTCRVRMVEDGEIFGGDMQPIYENEIVETTIGQFTGLKDCNGKDIYEGDILKSDHFYPSVVNYSADYAQFRACDINFYDADCEWEIIGNIHENKDLLS